MDKKEEKTLEEKSKIQTNAEEHYLDDNWDYILKLIRKKCVIWFPRSIRIRIVWVAGDSFDKIGYLCKTLAFQLFVMYKVVEQ